MIDLEIMIGLETHQDLGGLPDLQFTIVTDLRLLHNYTSQALLTICCVDVVMHVQVSRSCWAAEPAAIMRVLLLLAASAQLCLCFRPMSTVRRVAPSMSLEQLQKQRPTSKAAATAVAGIVTAAASFAPLNLPAVAATGPDPLPSNIRELLTEVKQANEPLVLRDAIKKLAEVDSLDELYFDSGARSVSACLTMNTT